MSETKWTERPWAVFGEHDHYVHQFKDGKWGLIVADCSMTDEGTHNAHLIAAAPDLFEALECRRCHYREEHHADPIAI